MVLLGRLAGVLLLLLLILDATPASAASGVTLQVTAGFGGYGRLGDWLPLSVDAENSGPDVQAELVATQPAPASSQTLSGPVIQAPQPSYATRYSMRVDLAHGAHKRFTFHLPLEALGHNVDVRLLAGDTVLAEASAPITLIGPEQLLVGLVSDERTSLPALGQVQLPAVSGEPVTLRIASVPTADLPSFPEELSNLDVLLLSHASTDRLSPVQQIALEGWVARGGLLILSGGSDWQQISGGLPADLLPVQQPALRVLPTLAGLAGFVGIPWKASGPSAATTGDVRGHILVQQDGVPLLALLPYGQGNVAFSAVDLTGQPLETWQGAPALWQHLLLFGLPPVSLSSPSVPTQVYYDPKANLTGALSNLPPASQPTWRLLGGILALYLLAAPASWLLLRRLGRPGLTWLALPLLALAVAGWTYGIAFRERGGVAIINAITVTEYPANAAVGQVASFLGLFVPNEQSYHVRFATPSLLTSMATPLYKRFPSTSSQPAALGLSIREDGQQVDLLPIPQWTARAVHSARWVAGPSGIEAHLTGNADGIAGTVTNRTGHELADCAISTPWGAQGLGALADGASATFHLSRQPGAARPLQQLFGFSPNQPAWPPAEQRRRQVQQQLINTLWSYAGPFGPNDPQLGSLLFIGWGDPVPADLTVDGRRVPEAGLGLLVAGLPVPDEVTGSVPAGLLQARFVAGDSGAMQKGTTIDLSNASVTVTAPLPRAAPALGSVTLRLTSPIAGRALAVSVAALNQQTGTYDTLPLTTLGGTLSPAATPTPVRSVPATPTPAPPGKGAAKVSAVAKAVLIVSAPALIRGGGVAIGPTITELDATLAGDDLRPYLDADNAARFRVTSSGTTTILNWPITYGYTTAGVQP